jgi:hypothetical protein
VVITTLFITLVYSSFIPFFVFAEQPNSRYSSNSTCDTGNMPKTNDGGVRVTCCWREAIPGQILGKEYCQTCTQKSGKVYDCTAKQPQALEQPPTSSPNDQTAPIQGGVSEEEQTPPTFIPGTSPGVLKQLEQGEGLKQGFVEQQQPPNIVTQPSLDSGRNVPPQQDFTKLTNSETLDGDNFADNEQNNDFGMTSEGSNNEENINNEQNFSNSKGSR